VQQVGASGDVMPVRVSTCADGILRVRLGRRDADSPASYLGARAWPEHAPGRASDIVAEASDATRVAFRDGTGRTLIRFATDESVVSPRTRLRFEIVGEQHFYGLGEGGQQFDRLGVTRRFWNYQANRGQGADMAIPLLVSQAGYAIFFDNAAAAYLEGGDAGDGAWIEYRSDVEALDLYVIGGPSLRAVMARIADLLGHATMPPRWALGFQQSSRHFEGTHEVRRLAEQFREKQLPCDTLIFLSTYGEAKGWNKGVGHLEFEPGLFDDPAAILGDFQRQHFHVISHEYPVLHPRSPLFAEAERAGYLLESAYPVNPAGRPRATNYKEGQRYIDFSRPEARAWWWRQHRHLVDLGVAGWWLDGGEGPPAETALHGGPATALHNRYDLLRQQAFAEGEATDCPDRRPYLLCRSGGPGMQRFGAMPWSGDINTTFETFETQIRTGLNVGLSGVPHWGTDIGGFYRVAPDQGELFARWFQFGAFCSVFRAHGFVWRYHLPWSHGDAIEAICARYLALRYSLMPYTYTMAWQAHRLGLPLMRPLVLDHQDDPRVWDLGTQYLWGDDILVAPVTRAGATHWAVYLPQGTWHDYWSHQTYTGPVSVTVETPLDRLPLFVRGGAIVPFGPPMQYDGERPADALTILIYPEGASSFTLYEDDGASNGYLRGQSVRTTFSCEADARGASISVSAPEGDASLIPAKRSYTLKVRAAQRPRVIAGDAGGSVEWQHDGHFAQIAVGAAPARIRIDW
jgi:alpha-glucosidase